MHLSIKMVRQPPIIIQPRQIRTTHIADLQLLVAARPRCIRERLEFGLVLGLGEQRRADTDVFFQGARDEGGCAEDFDFEEAGLDGFREIGNLF